MTTSDTFELGGGDGPPAFIRVVADEAMACPRCGAHAGHPDPALDFPNRFKVDDFCRCENPACLVGFYNPYTGQSDPT